MVSHLSREPMTIDPEKLPAIVQKHQLAIVIKIFWSGVE